MGALSTLWILARPKMLPFLALLLVGGYGWGHWDRALTARGGSALLLTLLAWTALHAGTMWLNAGLDRDEGQVLFGRPRPVPTWIRIPGVVALFMAMVLGVIARCEVGLLAVVSAWLAWRYSAPRAPWKGHPLGGPLVNWLGYGLITPAAGWATVGVYPNLRTLAVWLLASFGVLGVYFLAQVFQEDEDRARGYHTRVVTHGPLGALALAHLLIAMNAGGGLALAALGWLPRALLVLVPLVVWNSLALRRWAQHIGEADARAARQAVSRMLFLALSGLAAAGLCYAVESRSGGPVAGLSTASGLPADRAPVPPFAARLSENALSNRGEKGCFFW